MPYFSSINRAFPELSFRNVTLPVPVNGRKSQLFVNHCVRGESTILPPPFQGKVLKNDKVSVVIFAENGLIYKFIKPRKWHEYYKVFYGFSRTSKEVKANLRLKELGFSVPVVREYSIAVVPTHIRGFTGYYVMERVSGLGDAHAHFHKLNNKARSKFVSQLIEDLLKLKKNRIIYADLSLSNIFCSEAGDLCWIDTAIKEYSASKQSRFEKEWERSFTKLMTWESKLKILHENELLKIQTALASD